MSKEAQITSFAWTDRIKRIGSWISMYRKGHCLDNNFIERLWLSLKYEWVYWHASETGSQAKPGVGRWITIDNFCCPHAAHGARPSAVVYTGSTEADQQVHSVT